MVTTTFDTRQAVRKLQAARFAEAQAGAEVERTRSAIEGDMRLGIARKLFWSLTTGVLRVHQLSRNAVQRL